MRIRFVFLAMVVGMINLAHAGSDISDKQVRAWVAEGRILPFEEIYARNKDRLSGHLLDLEIEQEDGRIVYEAELLDAKGDVWELYIDAVTGEVVKEEQDD
ncbi:PepSY domain-containing protein [Amphritea japonica]|nr:PepSY domain-containing protein [Amphritea japonica]